MKTAVKKIAKQVKALPESELDEFLSWLAEYEMGHPKTDCPSSALMARCLVLPKVLE